MKLKLIGIGLSLGFSFSSIGGMIGTVVGDRELFGSICGLIATIGLILLLLHVKDDIIDAIEGQKEN